MTSLERSATPVARAYVELAELSVISKIYPDMFTPSENTIFELEGIFAFASENITCNFQCVSGSDKTVYTGNVVFSTDQVVECELSGNSTLLGLCEVSLFQNGVQVSTNSLPISGRSPIFVEQVTPSTSTTAGGTLIKIEGSGFPDNVQPTCHFGLKGIAKAAVVSSSEIACSTPVVTSLNNTEVVDMWVTFGGIKSPAVSFLFYTPVYILDTKPDFGPADGGTLLSIEGKNIFPELKIKCLFDGIATVDAKTTMKGITWCIAPQMKVGAHMLEIIVEGASRISNTFVNYEAVPREQVFEINPSRGIQTRATERKIRVSGENFIDSVTLICTFDDIESPGADFISPSQIECVVPFTRLGKKVVRVSNNGVDFSKSSAVYEVLARLSIASMWPRQGSFLGGTLVTLSGVFGNYEGIECLFGERSVPARLVNSSLIECTAPPGTMNETLLVSARIYNTFAHVGDDVDVNFTYVIGPIVSTIVPSTISQMQKLTNVSVVGSGLNAVNLVGCQFSGQPVSHLYRDRESVWCTFDARRTGIFELVLIFAANVFELIPTHQTIRVISAIQPMSISPVEFDERGGIAAIISTLNIVSTATSLRCLFGSTIVRGMALSASEIRCVTPPMRPGNISLQLSQDNHSWSEKTLYLVAYAAPVLFSAIPNQTVAVGGLTITVYGTNLKPFLDMKCCFGGTKTPAVSINESMVKCITPTTIPAGVISLGVSLNGIETSSNTMDVMFYDTPSSLRIRSIKELTDGRWSAYVEGANISLHDEYECRFDGKPRPVTPRQVTSHGIECVTDPQIQRNHPSTVTLAVHNAILLHQDVIINSGCPSFVYGPSSLLLRPGKSHLISVSGYRFHSSMELACHIDHMSVVGVVRSEGTMECILPTKIPGYYILRVTCAAGLELAGVFPVEYAHPPRVETFEPKLVPTGDAYAVDFFGENFDREDLIYCMFGSAAMQVQARFVATHHIRCSTHRSWIPGEVLLTVVLETFYNRTEILYQSPFAFTDWISKAAYLNPDFGSASGGYAIGIALNTSRRDYENNVCKFVGVDTEFHGEIYRLGSDQLGTVRCQVPRMKPGVYSVLISPNGRDYQSTSMVFSAHLPIQITSVDPSHGISSRKMVLTISGKGFHPWMRLKCAFKGMHELDWASSRADYISDTQVKCETPVQRPENGVLQLLPVTSLLYPEMTTTFEYKQELVFQSIIPDSGSTSGGVAIDVFGQGFSSDLDIRCRFSTESSKATFVNATLIRCRTPASRAMAVPLRFSLGVNNIFKEYFMFTYWPPHEKEVSITPIMADGELGSVDMASSKLEYAQLQPAFVTATEPKPMIRLIQPASGWTRGGTVVAVHGSNMVFSQDIECVFGGATVSAAFISSLNLVCISPPFAKPGRTSFSVRSGGEQWEVVTPLLFDMFNLPSITSLKPLYGNVRGGTNIVLQGNFSGFNRPRNIALFCSFGEVAFAPARFTNESEIRCTSPPATAITSVELGLFFGKDDVLPLPYTFHYRVEPEFTSTTPSIISEYVGGFVKISGAGFHDSGSAFCSYSFAPTSKHPLVFKSEEEIQCLLPRLKPGLVEIRVSFNGNDILSTGLLLTVKVKPTLLSMTPQVDSVLGGATVEISGLHLFFTESLRCIFGTMWVDASLRYGKVVCTVPPSPSLSRDTRVNVSLVSDAIQYAPETFELLYTPLPLITSTEVFPDVRNSLYRIQLCGRFPNISSPMFIRLDQGKDETKTTHIVTMNTGRNLNSSCQVFGVKEAEGDCSIGCDLLVSVNNQTFVATGKQIKLSPLTQILSAAPLYGSFRGHEIVRIKAKHLLPSVKLYCLFASSIRKDATLIDRDYAECETPSHSAGPFRMEVVVHDEEDEAYVLKEFNFRFVGAMEITSATPLIGLARGGTRVVIRGKEFAPHKELRCQFGEVAVAALYANDSLVICASPPMFKSEHLVPLSVSLGRSSTLKTDANKHMFSYIDTPRIQQIVPRSGMYNKDYVIKLLGTGFAPEMTAACRFGENGDSIPANVTSRTELICTFRMNLSSDFEPGKILPVALSISGETYIETGFSFNVFKPVVLTGVIPDAIIPARTDRIELNCLDVFPSRDWQCKFEDLNLTTIARFISRNKIHCETPVTGLLRAGTIILRLLNDGIEYSVNSVNLDVLELPEIFDFEPKSREIRMALSSKEDIVDYIIISGKNFVPFRRIDCQFGSLGSLGTFLSTSRARCRIPMSPTPNIVPVAISFNGFDFVSAPQSFGFLQGFTINRIAPVSGAVSGGTTVHIYGGEFETNEMIECNFGGHNSSLLARVLSSTEIICTSPNVLYIGKVNIGIWSATRRLVGNTSNAFTYTKEPVVLMVSPLEALEKFETLFDIYGRGFVHSPQLGCDFSGSRTIDVTGRGTAQAIWVSSTHIKCLSPATNESAGNIRIGVTNNGADFVRASRSMVVHFRTQFDISEIYPSIGSSEGGTAVLISGKHFDDAERYWCRFGDSSEASSATIVNAEELICVSPSFASNPGKVVIYLSVNGREFVSTRQFFHYQLGAQLFKLSPTRGSMDGSTMITVSGVGFLSDSTFCRFGETLVRAFVHSDSELVCIAPTNRYAESVPFEISINDGVDFTQNGERYEYVLAPRIRQVYPLLGPAAGGTLVQIAGLNLYSSKLSQCCFGDRYHCVHGWLLNDTTIECVTPPSPAKLSYATTGSKRVPILLALNGQDVVVLKMQFEYVLDAIVEEVKPAVGDTDGGTMVSLHGRHFRYSTELECRFGNTRTLATFWNDSVISCEAPAHPTGNTSFGISLNGQNVAWTKSSFGYIRLPSVYKLIPDAGPLRGGYALHLSGDSFLKSTTVMCQFSQDDNVLGIAVADYESRSEVSCKVAPSSEAGSAFVSLSVDGISSPRLQNLSFLYYKDIVLHTLEPWLCDNGGGCSLLIFGDNFRRDAQLECCFGMPGSNDICVEADFISDTRLHCISPPIKRVDTVELSVRSFGVPVSNQFLLMEVHHPIIIDKIFPVTGRYLGGTSISVEGWNFRFTPQLSCCFDDARVPATFINASRIECLSPSLGTRTAIVRVSNNGQDCLNGGEIQKFDFLFPASVIQVKPNIGTRLGGTKVLVQGDNFKVNESSCFFGSTQASMTRVLSDTEIECTTPAQSSVGRLRVIVADNNLDYSSDPVFFTFIPGEEVKALSPHRISSIEGGKVIITTENARDTANLSCFFNEVSSPGLYESSSRVHCSIPRLTPGHWSVFISNDGILKSQSFVIIQLVEPPLIASVEPLTGTMEGGELVSVVGSRLNLVSHCSFGKELTSAYIVSANLLQCKSPSQTTYGDVRVKLWDHGAEVPSQEILFTYLSPDNATMRKLALISDDVLPLFVPTILSIDPPDVPIIGGTIVTVRGFNFSNSIELACRFGVVVVGARYQSSEQIVCTTPRLHPNRYGVQVSNDGRVFSNNPVSIGVYTDTFVEYITPTHGPQTGGTAVTIYGMHFKKSSNLRCRFGDMGVTQVIKYVSSTEIVCISPPQRDLASVVRLTVTNNNVTFTPNPVFFSYTTSADIVSVTPSFGSIVGGTELVIRWYNLEISNSGRILCRIGSINSGGEVLGSNMVKCVTPGAEKPGKELIQVSANGRDFTASSTFFEYVEDIVIHELVPNLGPTVDANTIVTIRGSAFINSVDLTCIFRSGKVSATFINPSMISCAAPRDTPGRVTVRVSNNGMDVSSSSATYLYVKDMSVSRLFPTTGLKEGGTTVFFQGRNFVNHTLLACRFGAVLSPATYLSESVAACVAPRQLIDLRKTNGVVSVEMTSNHVDFTNSGLEYTYLQKCPSSQFCTNGNILACPNGTICESHHSTNFSVCSPGSFQSRQNQVSCLPCPVGFFCPDHGMTKPLLCRAGMVCDEHGLRTPVKGCPSGHYCRKGTKTADIRDFTTNVEYSIDKETQLASFVESSRAWALISRVFPAIGSRRIEHPPSLANCDSKLCMEGSTILVAERPYSCPIGTFCRRGVAVQQLQANNYSAPQRCYPGFFCPRGSSTPEGKGPCPTGHYCPDDVDAIVCPAGQYCPGVGNLRPRDCYPGTYNPIPQQSNCTLCPTGNVCPQPKMQAPVLCPAGFVCISTGLAAPVLLCPAGYICREGTRTLDPSDSIPYRPMPCPKGTYCLGGVAHNTTIDWVPSRPEGAVAPQSCTEGTFCEEATPTLSGTGVCYAGHYCPPGSSAPTQAQVGSFAGTTGSVASTMCFPGTYTPLKATAECEICPAGHSCPGYGTYIPSLCPRGFYRSLADSITCRACPEGTWSPHTGLADISYCEICPAGRVCGSSGMFSMASSLPCAAGYVCGEGTNRRAQFDHLCPGGHYCSSATPISEQYTHVCEKGNICVRGTKTIEKNKSKCPDGKFCPLGTANSSSIYINCPSGTWSSSSEDELVDCSIRPVPICDKLPEKQYYPQFTYDFQGSQVSFDSTVETSRTGEVEVVNVVYPVNESASVSFWKNDTIDAIRVCPAKMSTSGGVLLTVIGRNFQNTDRLVCKFQLPKSPFSQIAPAFFVSSTRVTCRAPPFIGNDTAATGTSFSRTVQVSVSNYGVHFSTTSATFRIVSDKEAATLNMKEVMATCLKRDEMEEGFRNDDKAWFPLTGLGKAKLSFDFRHLPGDLIYDEHYKIAIFVKNSTCEDETCDSRGVVLPSGPDIETSPCHRPVELPRWFLSTAVDKNDLLNITLLALEDVTFKVEIHVMYGLYASVAPFFVNSTVVKLKTPTRSNVTQGVTADTRPLSRSISYEAEMVPRDYTFLIAYFGGDEDYTSPPLNLPPKYEAYERGRVLLSHNVSSMADEVPLVVDPYKEVITDTSYWLMPYGSAALTHEKVEKYRETFQEMYLDTTDPSGSQYLFRFEKMLLPYLPFLSNCMEYDSYTPLFDLFESDSCQLPATTSETGSYGRTWWRRAFPPLPNQDDIRYVGPLDVAQEPTADICMMDIQCNYEEDLPTADVTPRWFEQSAGTVLYFILREPATLADYLRGGKYYDDILDEYGLDYFIPVTVDNTAAQSLEGDCSTLCFPRSVTLDVAYYQLDKHVKRIIKVTLVYDNYDRDSSNTQYTFSVNLHPLGYFQLIIQFAFEKQVFVGLFFVLGGMMTAGALIFWIVVRITSFLQSPPRFRFWTVFALIAPPPSVGVAMASLPIFSVVCSFYLLLNGDKYFASSGYWLMDNIVPHYLETKIDPDAVAETRKGRVGLCFLVFGLYLVVLGTRIFLPKPIAISEKVMAEQNDQDALERSIWWPTQWKRANMIFASIMLGLFLVLMLEFSFWSSFGNYMFYVIVAQEIVNAIMEAWIESQLKEALLMAPLVSALNLIGGIMTFGATDFGDFVFGNTLDFGMMLLMRVYVETVIEAVTDFVKEVASYCWGKVKIVGRGVLLLFRSFTRSTAAVAAVDGKEKKKEKEKEKGKVEAGGESGEGAETVEPIIEFYADCSMERLALFYQPILILIMMFFREEVMLPILYNIREKDMEIYLWYSLIILFFQLVTEVFVLNVVEIFQGWKLYDYLVYCRYRFLQREQRWKGLEPNLDECIDEGLRTLDQMCFSSQFFMMSTVHITGIVFFVVGIEIIARASYNLFGDPAMPLLLAFILAASTFVKSLVLFLAVKFEVWKIKHENTAWLAPPDEDDEFGVPRWDELEKIKGASHEAYLMNQRITSDTFRNKFLTYNRSWLVNQLPSILTPRTLRRARPYLLAQFAKILDSLNPQVSDDDEEDDGRPRFGPVTLSAPSRTIIRLWLARARRILRLKTVVQPLIQQARKSECEMCLSRRQLQVEMAIPIEVLGDKFESQTLSEEFDAAAWKDFFAKHQKFKTLCLNCIVHLKTTGQLGDLRGLGDGGPGGDGMGGDGGWGAAPLNAASYALLQKWYRKAQDRVFGKSGKRRHQLDVSDDEEETMQHQFEWTRQPVALNAASTALARKWLIAARLKLREPGRARGQLPTNLTSIHPTVRGGATPVPKPAVKMGAAGGEAVKASKMRRK